MSGWTGTLAGRSAGARLLTVLLSGCLASACTPYRAALMNNLGSPAEIIVLRADGSRMTGSIPTGQRLMMYDRLSQVEGIRYALSRQACTLNREELSTRVIREGSIDIVRLSPCIEPDPTQPLPPEPQS